MPVKMPRSSKKDESTEVTEESMVSSVGGSSVLSDEKAKTYRKRKNTFSFKPNSNKKKRATLRNSENKSQETERALDGVTSFSQNEKSNLSESDKSSSTNQTRNSIPLSQLSDLTGSQISATPQLTYEDNNDEEKVPITDKNFIQQQVRLLLTSFSLQDCPKLVNLQGNKSARRSHISQDITQEALTKLNHKMNDEIQKHLNRQSQRKVLGDILEFEKEILENDNQDDQTHINETMDICEILRKCPKEWRCKDNVDNNLLRKYSTILSDLKETNDKLKEAKDAIVCYKSSSYLTSEVEYLAKETSLSSFKKEIVRTNRLVNQVIEILCLHPNSA